MSRWQLPLKKETTLAVGIMSGTSMDGVDAALVEITGSGFNTKVKLLHFETISFDDTLKQRIFSICKPEESSVEEICRLNVILGEKMADAAIAVVAKSGRNLGEIDFISSHGQTIYHIPEENATLQIGELAVIANKTGCLTVGDFRPSDMAAGGQGAPLVPFVDQVLFRKKDTGRILINIGGMANLTVLSPEAAEKEVLAFDTGPGNVLIDEIVRMGTDGAQSFDKGGRLSEKGVVKDSWLAEIIQRDTYLTKPFPKSTGREYYNRKMAVDLWEEGRAKGFSFEDITATVTSYTVQSISLTIQQLDQYYQLEEILIGGGGVHNKFIMNGLKQELKRPVMSMEEIDFSSDAKEAIAFAILGNEFLRQQPNNVPSATGAAKLISMGKLTFPSM